VAVLAVALGALGGCSEGAPPRARIPEPVHLNRDRRSCGCSQAVKIGRTVYVPATVAVDGEGRLIGPGDMAAPRDAVGANLAATLASESGGLAQVVMERIDATDMEAPLKVADRRLHFCPEDRRPAPTWVGARRLVDPGCLAAIEAVAELP
jgi:enamine deaminase RidA (YjgF/YER057c/UK114 family)